MTDGPQFTTKKRSRSTMSLSLELLRREGFIADTCESYNFFSKRRKDLFTFGDLVGVKEGEFLIIQTTTRPHMSERWVKIKKHPASVLLLTVPGVKIEVWGWFKEANRWKCERWNLDERT
jgi:hypothetical protein